MLNRQDAIDAAVRSLREQHGDGEPDITIRDDGSFQVTWRRSGKRKETCFTPTTVDPRIPEWGLHNPCAFRRFANKLGAEKLERFYRMLRRIGRSATKRPSVALCCAVLNEGPDLEGTIKSLLAADSIPNHFVFVDDSSRNPISDRVREAFGRRSHLVTQSRMPERFGVGECRTIAHMRVDADVYIFIDAHMRFPDEWLDVMLDAHADHPNAVLCSASVGMDGSPFRGAGCGFTDDGAGFIKGTWLAPRPTGECPIVPCVMGACYLVPKHILNAIAQWGPGLTGFGMDEEYLSLRAWVCGFEVRCVTSLAVAHRYKTEADRVPAAGASEELWEMPHNRRIVAAMCFEDGVYENTLRPAMVKHESPQTTARIERELVAKAGFLNHVRNHIQANRVRSDAEVARICGFDLSASGR